MKPQLGSNNFSSICWEKNNYVYKNDSDLVAIMYIPGRSPSAIAQSQWERCHEFEVTLGLTRARTVQVL